jgi:hypothetical protein
MSATFQLFKFNPHSACWLACLSSYCQIINKDVPPRSNAAHAMYIRVHPPLFRLGSTNRPLAVLSVVDNELGLQLLQQGRIDMEQELQRFQTIIMSQVRCSYYIMLAEIEVWVAVWLIFGC